VKWFKYLISAIFFLYLVTAAGLYWYQEKLIFLSDPVDASHTYQFENSTQDIWLKNNDGLLHGVLFKNPIEQQKGVVLYFKGNMGNVGHSERLATLFLGLGYDVVSMDYRGSGKSRGKMSEEKLLTDAEQWHDWATQNYGKKVKVVGYSLGTTFASHIAAVKEVSHTILFAPMRSVEDIAAQRYPYMPRFITRYPFRNYEKLSRTKGQVVIYHGTADQVIPYESGAALRTVLDDDDTFYSVKGANHYNIALRHEVQSDIILRWQ